MALDKRKSIKFYVVVFIACLFFNPTLLSINENWNQILDRPVRDMKFSNIPGIYLDGLVFNLADNNSLGYFTGPDTLNEFLIEITFRGFISITPDNENNRILCLSNIGSRSDGLWAFDVTSETFSHALYYPFAHFVKDLPSGFYVGRENGIIHSEDGNNWIPMTFFYGHDIRNIVETSDGTIFLVSTEEIFMENEESYVSYQDPFGRAIKDIIVHSYQGQEEIYVALINGTSGDGIYKVMYQEEIITGFSLIERISLPEKLHHYGDYLVVGTNVQDNHLFLVEPIPYPEGEIFPIGVELELNEITCFATYPMEADNILIRTDMGVFLGQDLIAMEVDSIVPADPAKLLFNYPNPFNAETTITFEIPYSGEVELSVYNLKGQRMNRIIDHFMGKGSYNIVWKGEDLSDRTLSSGIYILELILSGNYRINKKCLLLK